MRNREDVTPPACTSISRGHTCLSAITRPRERIEKALEVARPNSIVGQKAARNLSRLHDALCTTAHVPRWLAWPVSTAAVLGTFYAVLVQHLKVDSAGFVGFVRGMLFVVFTYSFRSYITKDAPP